MKNYYTGRLTNWIININIISIRFIIEWNYSTKGTEIFIYNNFYIIIYLCYLILIGIQKYVYYTIKIIYISLTGLIRLFGVILGFLFVPYGFISGSSRRSVTANPSTFPSTTVIIDITRTEWKNIWTSDVWHNCIRNLYDAPIINKSLV